MTASPLPIVLASTSRYRRELLERFRLPFVTESPEVDESARPGEAPPATAERLAEAKARAVADRHPAALIIGSDQVAHMGAEVFGKPGSIDAAIAQLGRMNGRTVIFHTALCLFNSASGECRVEAVPTEVRFRPLTAGEIERYVHAELPLDCAGSAKSEGLGITLLEALRGDDPNALVGLPLITLARMLRSQGVTLP